MDIQGSTSSTQLAIQYQAQVLSMQKNAMNAVGDSAIQLIQSAVIADPAQGQNLNITA